MAQLSVPNAPKEYPTHYRNLLGIDYQSDQTEVSRRRSPDMVNMISDLGGNPIKRSGYRPIGEAYAGMTLVNTEPWGVRKTYTGLRVYPLKFETDGITRLKTVRIENSDKCGAVKHVFAVDDDLYIFCEKAWYRYDTAENKQAALGVSSETMYALGESVETDVPHFTLNMPKKDYIPTVYTMYKPAGNELVTLPSGTDLSGATQGVNLLTPFRVAEYCVQTDTAEVAEFKMPQTVLISDKIKVEILDSTTFDWKEVASDKYTLGTASNPHTVLPDDENTEATTACIEAKITFNETPYIKVEDETVHEQHLKFRDAQTVDVPAGVPNVRITYAPFVQKPMETGVTTANQGYYKKNRNVMFASDATEWYEARLFVAVKSTAYYSRVNKPFVIDDDYYINSDSKIMMFARASSALALVGEDTGNNTIYLAKGDFSDSLQMTVYSIKISNAGIGAVSSHIKGTLNDEPLFFARTGIYGLSTNYLSEKYAINRSANINKRLCAEKDLQNAVGISFNNYFYLCINSHMYVLDGRHRDTTKSGTSSYECYFFDSMPDIKAMYIFNGVMYFTDDEYTYTWNDDMPEQLKYYDELRVDADGNVTGRPVKAKWSSLFDDDGAPQRLKTLMKKGSMVLLTPYYETGCEITLGKDGNVFQYLGRFDFKTQAFDMFDFIEVSFAPSAVSVDVFTKKKIKK